MIHHSRNTAQKQWAETKVLTISGVVRVFNTKRKLLRVMGDYSKAWVLLLEYVEKMALSDTSEVSLAALKALQVSICRLKVSANLNLLFMIVKIHYSSNIKDEATKSTRYSALKSKNIPSFEIMIF